jgi:hypothetical protein
MSATTQQVSGLKRIDLQEQREGPRFVVDFVTRQKG